MAMPWENEHLPAIVQAWYPGEEGGRAVAQVLLGEINPAGRLPVTFYKASEKLPAFDDYNMRGRTYRYFEGEPLYPFGYGLSYTRFEYSDLKVAGSQVSFNVKNVGSRAGQEVPQLYVRQLDSREPRALKDLRAFQRVELAPGETRRVTFNVIPERDFTHYDVANKRYAVDPGRYELQVGASSADIRLKSTMTVGSQ
jgi:beta-glucosidase